MNTILRTLIYFILFNTAYAFINLSGVFPREILFHDIGGIPWLYSTIGVIFSMISAFIIQRVWDKWNTLIGAIKSEVDSLYALWLWSKHFPPEMSHKIHHFIVGYLEIIIKGGLLKAADGHRSEQIEIIMNEIYDDLFEIYQKDPQLLPTSFSIFTDIIRYRNNRIHQSTLHLPEVLRYTFIFSVYLLIMLSLFIGIQNVWLDYLFTFSIASLVFVIYLVVDDLDNPLRPGIWHISTKDYKDLLQRLEKNHQH